MPMVFPAPPRGGWGGECEGDRQRDVIRGCAFLSTDIGEDVKEQEVGGGTGGSRLVKVRALVRHRQEM